MVEGRNPLVAYLRASQRSHNSQSKTVSVKLAVLRRAWNAFARLLSINFETAFQCQVCGQHPETVVCDGTMLGFRKDFLSSCPDSQPNATLPLLTGSKHEERILLRSTRSRSLLPRYAGITANRKKMLNPKPLTATELASLKASLSKDGFQALADLVVRLCSEHNSHTCPEPYREFLSELSRNTPVCGLIQIGGGTAAAETIKVLESLARNDLDIHDSSNFQELGVIQSNAPVLAGFLTRCPKNDGKFPQDVCNSAPSHQVEAHTPPQPSPFKLLCTL